MGEVTIASTTDTQDEVNQAAGGAPQDQDPPELKPAPTGDPQVESGEPEEPIAQPEKKEEKALVPRAVDKRIDKLTRQNSDLAAKLAALEAKQNGTPPPEEKKVEIPTEVAAKFDTFDAWSAKQLEAGKAASIDDFLEARDAWKEARDTQRAEREAVQQHQAEIAETYNARVEEFKAEHPDWDDVVGAAEIDIPPGVGPALQELDNGPAVVWFLATHPADAKKLGNLSPFLAVAEVGRIAARLEKAAPEETPTNGAKAGPDRQPIVSRAPAPIAPLKGNAVRATTDLNDPTLSYEEYRKIRDAQEKARFRR
jgi:hypothetical protein